jgi:hypothetical protein
MSVEIISKIEILKDGKMRIKLKSGGKQEYQFVYREAKGVYWNNDFGSFETPEPKVWTHEEWFRHVIKTVEGMGISLKQDRHTRFINVPHHIKEGIYSDA